MVSGAKHTFEAHDPRTGAVLGEYTETATADVGSAAVAAERAFAATRHQPNEVRVAWLTAIADAFAASRACDLFLSVGTSTIVYPAASLPFEALEVGATVMEINPQPTPLSRQADFVLSGPAGVVLPEFLKRLHG